MTAITKALSEQFVQVDWPVENVLAFSTTRAHPDGVTMSHSLSPSTFPLCIRNHFATFNLGAHVGDDPKRVDENRLLLRSYFPANYQIQWLEQVHGNGVAIVESVAKQAIVADAVITKEKDIVLSIMTADCLPILLASKSGDEIAAIHGGWKPLSKGIIENTVRQMTTAPNHIFAWLGPCIGAQSFEVGADVRSTFTRISTKFAVAFSLIESAEQSSNTQPPKKYFANLALIAKIQLTLLGIKTISHERVCTYTEQQRFYSYRRDKNTGRMATVIARN